MVESINTPFAFLADESRSRSFVTKFLFGVLTEKEEKKKAGPIDGTTALVCRLVELSGDR